jgi:hypothetical protein
VFVIGNARGDDADDQRGLRRMQYAHDEQNRHDRGQRSTECADVAVTAPIRGATKAAEIASNNPQAGTCSRAGGCSDGTNGV